ncbi:MAG: hypothetical protein ABIY71_05165 [Flavobacteriales bacterium]
MKTTDRFADLKEFRAEKARLQIERTANRVRLEQHFQAWKEPHFRKAMVKDVVGDITHLVLPKGILGSLLGKADLGSGLRMALGAGGGGLLKRAGLFALGIAAPSMLSKLENISLPEIGNEFQVSWQRLKEHMRERRAERREEQRTS